MFQCHRLVLLISLRCPSNGFFARGLFVRHECLLFGIRMQDLTRAMQELKPILSGPHMAQALLEVRFLSLHRCKRALKALKRCIVQPSHWLAIGLRFYPYINVLFTFLGFNSCISSLLEREHFFFIIMCSYALKMISILNLIMLLSFQINSFILHELIKFDCSSLKIFINSFHNHIMHCFLQYYMKPMDPVRG